MRTLPAASCEVGCGESDYVVAVEFATLTLDATTKSPVAKIYRPAEIEALLKSEGLLKQEQESEMQTD